MNRFTSRVLIALLLFTLPALAEDIWIPIVGTISNFRTDVRVLNPSFEDDVTVNAYFYPRNVSTNATVQPTVITIPARSMRVFDDVTDSMFSLTGDNLGAIRLQTEGDIEATARIYAVTEDGTLGQFEIGIDAADARTKGALLQLKSFGTPAPGFRTNVGGANPNSAEATVMLVLYDRNDAVIGSAKEHTIPPFGAFGPLEIRGFFGSSATGADLTDAWVSFESDLPVILYGSVVDNATTDPTFVSAVGDSGIPPVDTVKVFNISARQWEFTADRTLRADVGDRVRLRITSQDVEHGFTMPPYISNLVLRPGVTAEAEFDLVAPATLFFACTQALCGVGHVDMNGTFIVGSGGQEGDPGY